MAEYLKLRSAQLDKELRSCSPEELKWHQGCADEVAELERALTTQPIELK